MDIVIKNGNMCDCSVEKDFNDRQVPPLPIEQCLGQSMGEKDEYFVQNAIFDCKDGYGTRLLKSEPALPLCSTLRQPSSSECSSNSTRTYKFVDPCEFKFMRTGEEEELQSSPIICEPCIPDEEEEEGVQEEPDVECTLAIIKPEAVIYRKEIERRIYEEGFEVYQTRWLQLTPEQASEFYCDSYGQTNFAHLVAYMASGPIVAMVLAKQQAVQDWRMLMGPTKVVEARLYFPDSIRAKFGRRSEDFKNAVHGSKSREQAENEIHFFFPEFIVEPLLKGKMAAEYLWEVINTVLVEGLSLCCKVKPADPILWLANWLLTNNPYKPKMPEDLTLIPT